MKRAKKLQIQQLDSKIAFLKDFPERPTGGWIHSVRTAVNMSLRQFGSLMRVTAQSAQEMEVREGSDSITIKSLRQAASALNMKLVYGFLPTEGTFEKLVEKRALIVARNIVARTNTTMKLEDQQVSKERFEKDVRELAEEIINEMPRYLWD